MAYQPEAKKYPPKKKENPKKDQACHQCHEVGHWKRNCPLYLEELRAKKQKYVGNPSTSVTFTIGCLRVTTVLQVGDGSILLCLSRYVPYNHFASNPDYGPCCTIYIVEASYLSTFKLGHFTRYSTSNNPGKRVFDVYVQRELEIKDFEIVKEAGGAGRPLAYVLQEWGCLLKLVDPDLGSKYSSEEAMIILNVALLCTNALPAFRPTMPQAMDIRVERLLKISYQKLGFQLSIKSLLGYSTINPKFRALRNHFWQDTRETLTIVDDLCT
ncbi:leucine-rich repeat transmembrane protein kinase [Artemisia annua]|uniref:non-specific serine/threonine protein kinase n=1 Tax=Artemisia annua TaxID=35608 RepID=A0A2U1PCP0_ARTAN|nr:leucine-rich repeat transmembrane protein kinase [Artemisia annua]